MLDSPEIKPDSDPVAEVVALAGESQQIPRKVGGLHCQMCVVDDFLGLGRCIIRCHSYHGTCDPRRIADGPDPRGRCKTDFVASHDARRLKIIFCGLARSNQKRFSYIAHDSTLGLTISNVFSVKGQTPLPVVPQCVT